ncbi:MAG: OmcA/MtrC family decaheme c-type cytochrome, partial [Gammaproteobacteria bacterium]
MLRKYLPTIVVIALFLAGCGGDDGKDGKDGTDGSWYAIVPVSSAERLDIKIEKVTVSSPPVVTFKVTDGNGLSVAGVTTSQVRFNIARLEPSSMGNPSYWVNYLGPGATERVADNLEELEDGRYQYTFSKDITKDPNYDPTLTHRVAMQISDFPPANPVFDFRPDGKAVTTKREIVEIDSCNSCHNELALHGGGRVDTKYCVTCHNPGTIDPDTGNTVDFKVLVHKIHYGEELPSVNGSTTPFIPATPYQIIGYGGSVHDYSTVVFPQDIRNCTKCHEASAATPQGDNWKTRPSVEACGSCHDDIYFGAAAEPPLRMVAHPGGPTSNAFCVNCHVDGGNEEWKVVNAHRNSLKDAEGKFQYNILKVCGTDPDVADPDCDGGGGAVTPTVEFSVTDPTNAEHGYAGNNRYDIKNDPEFGGAASLNILTAWDSSDYTNVDGDGTRPARANSYSLGDLKTNATDDTTGIFTITLDPLPVSVTGGSGGIAMEGHPLGESEPG